MREHYAIQLTPLDGGKVTVFLHNVVAIWPMEDKTCVVATTKGDIKVKESEDTILTKAKMHNLIVRIS